ncbi:ATP-binding cassette domain-containing protein [Streptacidiphilus cavernicola]|uniref:ATP-binding cassette domain-containing protein n=1 Tax=Streptacidiphilus cavernicola TaxID=3342716 RepID=A0ABV6VN08_9ACTN
MLTVSGLNVGFGRHTVLHDVDLDLAEGRTLGLVGESGSGKSTLAKAVVGMVKPRSGSITVAAEARRVQLVPQDPYGSLNPRMTVGQTLAEAIDPRRGRPAEHRDRIAELLETVALDPQAADRYPHQFSGGQRQRVAIARALAVRPALLIADEITSALDCSVQAEVLNVLRSLRVRFGLTMLFISHDLAVVRHVSDEIAVMRAGEIVERAPRDQLFRSPAHAYTQRLLASALY